MCIFEQNLIDKMRVAIVVSKCTIIKWMKCHYYVSDLRKTKTYKKKNIDEFKAATIKVKYGSLQRKDGENIITFIIPRYRGA